MRELLREQRESQTRQVERMERRHAEQVHQHETTLGQMSDIQAAVTALRDERRAHSEQLAEERAGEKAGGYPVVFCQTSNFEGDDIRIQDVQAVKQVFEGVVEAREGLRSMADGMTFLCPLILIRPRANRAAGRLDSPSRRITTYFVGKRVRTGKCVLERSRLSVSEGTSTIHCTPYARVS
jgi:hypothetical protein